MTEGFQSLLILQSKILEMENPPKKEKRCVQFDWFLSTGTFRLAETSPYCG